MIRHLLLIMLGLTGGTLAAQQQLSPSWKAGDAWILRAVAATPSDSKQVDEQGLLRTDTLYTDFRWTFEEETETHFIFSIQMTRYEPMSMSDEGTRRLTELYQGLHAMAPLRYLVKKDGALQMEEQSEQENSASPLTAIWSLAKSRPVLLNDTIIGQYVMAQMAEKRSVAEVNGPSEEAVAETVQEEVPGDAILSVVSDLKKGKNKTRSEEENLEAWESEFEEDFDNWELELPTEFYINTLKATFIKRIELLHTPFGTDIQQMGVPYSVEEISPQELAQLQLTPELMQMFKITGTYLFEEKEDALLFTSDISMDMQDFIKMLVGAFESAFAKEAPTEKKKVKKVKSVPVKESAVDKIPAMSMNMRSVWQLDRQHFTPRIYQMMVSSDIKEQEVEVRMEATEVLIFEKAE
jgi:hypothetical protein